MNSGKSDGGSGTVRPSLAFLFFQNLKGELVMAWTHLFIAGVFEVVWTVGLKYSHGFTRLYPSVVTTLGMIFSFYYLSLATKHLPLGTAYAIWTGIGVIGTVIMGIILFQESRNIIRLLFLCLIVIGIIGLKFTSKS